MTTRKYRKSTKFRKTRLKKGGVKEEEEEEVCAICLGRI